MRLELPYFYGFEICESKFLPEFIRKNVFLSLEYVQLSTGLRKVIRTNLKRFIERELAENTETCIVELGSGSGAISAELSDTINRDVHATDLYPQIASWNRLQQSFKNFKFYSTAMDMNGQINGQINDQINDQMNAQLPKQSSQLFFLNSAFHHMNDEGASVFLARVHRLESSVLVCEPFQRSWRTLPLAMASGVLGLLAPLGIKNISLKDRVISACLTWIFPIVPLILIFDGTMSVLRQRNMSELKHLATRAGFSLSLEKVPGIFRTQLIIFFKYL